MKKIILLLSTLLILFFAFVYLFIPNKIKIASTKKCMANRDALFRSLGDSSKWHDWWPNNTKDRRSRGFTYNGYQYNLQPSKFLSIPITISKENFLCNAQLSVLDIDKESSVADIQGIMPTSYNPFTRLMKYFTAREIKKNWGVLLDSIDGYYSSIKNMYGYSIQKERVVDSTLLFNYREIKQLPTTEFVYSLIDELKTYIQNQSAKETGYPMLNIFTNDSTNYLVKVAVPVDKKLPSSGNISYKWMLGGGNILITEVKGGPHEINKAYKQIEQYVSDYKRIAPAIPFESLVTDRRLEPDTAKWITKIYYPVM
jgi:hypothetical protein